MPQVPQYNRETHLNGTPLPYENYRITEDTSGASVAKAMGNIGKGLDRVVDASLKIKDTHDRMKMMEFNNAVEQWKQDSLLNKENGYFNKKGKDATGRTNEVMQSYDEFVQQWQEENRLSSFNRSQIETIAKEKRTNILKNVTAHDLQQTNEWATNETALGIDNAITAAVSERNNPDGIKTQINNIRQIVRWQGEAIGADATAIEKIETERVSQAYCSILDAKIQDGDLTAKKFFEEHKEEILSQHHAKYIGQIKNNEDKYTSRQLANEIIAKAESEEDAVRQAEAIEDVNMSESVLSRVKRHYQQEKHFEDLQQKEALDGFYTKAESAAKGQGTLSYDDIPDILDPKDKLALMNFINQGGQPETDNQIWSTLYEMQVNNAQGFANVDLNKYRGFLSEGDYKSFVKAQEKIKSGEFYSDIQDDNKMIDAALKDMKLHRGKKEDVAYSEIKSMVREFEARKGRSITDDELLNITNSLGYKGEDGIFLYKQLEKGMAEKTGFIKDVMNDFVYYQSKHNGQLPPNEEKYRIIKNRVNMKAQEKRTQAQNIASSFSYNAETMRNIAYTEAKPNEQKVLTFFADNQIPTISEQLGLNLTVTSRYRDQDGSHHKEGRAADISMSEHSIENRIRIYERLVQLPTVYKIGTSDINIIAHFKGNNKIVDERAYDRQHGTNHVNHAHITLINANPATPKKPNAIANNNVYQF